MYPIGHNAKATSSEQGVYQDISHTPNLYKSPIYPVYVISGAPGIEPDLAVELNECYTGSEYLPSGSEDDSEASDSNIEGASQHKRSKVKISIDVDVSDDEDIEIDIEVDVHNHKKQTTSTTGDTGGMSAQFILWSQYLPSW